jgi:nitrate reductase gamma subunit
MVLRIICAQIRLTKCVARAAFTLGAVAGTAGVIGICALRRAMQDQRAAARPSDA